MRTHPDETSVRVRFWGVRGSVPVPGPGTVRYGGNTSCVEVESPAGTRVIIDAGTGLRRLGKQLVKGEFAEGKGQAHILISHTHWDHIQGLPFFAPLYQAGNKLTIYARKRDDLRLRTVLAGQAEAPFFPVAFEEARADLDFAELPDGQRFAIADIKVTTARLNHPYVATAYALQAGGRKVAYVSDTAPFEQILFGEEFIAKAPAPGTVLSHGDQVKLAAMRDDVVRLCEGADLVIYDTMFTDADYQRVPHFGHSRPMDAIAICQQAGVRRLALFHHAPERSDDEVDKMRDEARVLAAAQAPGLEVLAAFEGLDIGLSAAARPAIQ